MEPKSQNILSISGRFERITNEQATGLSAGDYLIIETNFSKPDPIKLQDFQDKINEAKELQKNPIQSATLQTIADSTNFITEKFSNRPDFTKLMNFLSQHISIELKDGEEKLKIISNESIFLELPWENLVNRNIFIVREVVSTKKQEVDDGNNNLLLMVSSATSHKGEKFPPIKIILDEEIKEIYKLVGELRESETPTRFKLLSIFFLLHSTKDSLKNLVNWEPFNYVHLIMHGLSDGTLCLESPSDHDLIDPISVSDFVSMLQGNSFKLFFSSFCYSGGGVENGGNISFQIVKSGISQYAIGYSHPVGDVSANTFSKAFYESLLNGSINHEEGNNIEVSYRESLKKYYTTKLETKYIPFLYMNK